MAIVISGTGTIDGISAGGLPDDCVTADDLAETYLTPTGDGSSLTGISTPLSFRNLIINGAMTVNQRSTSDYTVNSSWKDTIDRYKGYANASDGVYTVGQSTTAPAGFKNSAKITVTTADSSIGSSQLYMWCQIIEAQNMAHLNWGTSDAETVTLSFWARSSLTGTFGVSLIEGNGITASYNATYTISSADTWEYKTITIAGDTSLGTWQDGNEAGIHVNFDLGCGSSNKGTANQWNSAGKYGVTGATDLIGTLNATLYITGLQLEVGSTATTFEHRSYDEELTRCQRYYYRHADYAERNGNMPLGLVSLWTSTSIDLVVQFPCQMRAAPSIQNFTGSTDWILYRGSANVHYLNSSGLALSRNGRQTVHLGGSMTAGGTAGQTAMILANTSGTHLSFDAEI